MTGKTKDITVYRKDIIKSVKDGAANMLGMGAGLITPILEDKTIKDMGTDAKKEVKANIKQRLKNQVDKLRQRFSLSALTGCDKVFTETPEICKVTPKKGGRRCRRKTRRKQRRARRTRRYKRHKRRKSRHRKRKRLGHRRKTQRSGGCVACLPLLLL